MGWTGLRSTQADAVVPILDGKHCLILAPTAGGKTEAAFIPVLSRMATEEWPGPSVLYVCPIKALLNNLESRLSRYAGFVGRTVQVWHGDVGQGAKARARRSAPDILLTTPESLEAMLISTKVDRASWFGDVRVVIADELHAFAGDDRGWHLRAVIKRIEAYARQPIQRLGLSATVGNPDELLDWFAGSGERQIVGSSSVSTDADVTIDHVGSMANAATVIARLHRGSKRLVFCDSRSRVEELGVALRSLNTRTFVSHSSLSASERKLAETAFAEEQDCVIVATSTLELGIDVGDLDFVIQIDSPSTVSSFLQRMGRTGRRTGSRRNYLFLTTTDEAFLLACAITTLWRERYVEHITPPPLPWHMVAQQMMALVLEYPGLPAHEVIGVARTQFPDLDPETVATVFDFMAGKGILFVSSGLVSIGPEGERLFGRAHFLDLLSAFASPMTLTARHGSTELGHVDPMAVQQQENGPTVLLLGGRSWKVMSVEWSKRTVWLEPSDEKGKSRWLGTSRCLGFEVCQAMRRVLLKEGDAELGLSKRGIRQLDEVRHLIFAPERQGSLLLEHLPSGRQRWWTFAGGAVNSALALRLGEIGRARVDELWVEIDAGVPVPELLQRPADHSARTAFGVRLAERSEMKFTACLCFDLLAAVIAERLLDEANLRLLLKP
ncbi:DEAD/DEAH box helicase [Accumulibacter sp.]|uniref:DEAD/DEAH box helicase n=1 Tax=Accumulibacter sp. TaxID=2053492 RepID=UPI0026200323|nr:DEAD/DEAH box helicase [Accumulibacter sp.]